MLGASRSWVKYRDARQVEATNGRLAMLGFLTSIITEAGTGHGILLQLVRYAKAPNQLGAASAFQVPRSRKELCISVFERDDERVLHREQLLRCSTRDIVRKQSSKLKWSC